MKPEAAARGQIPVLSEQHQLELVAALGRQPTGVGAAVPVEDEEAVALQEPVAGQHADQAPVRIDDLYVGAVGAGDPESDPAVVVDAIPVRREGPAGLPGSEADLVEDQRLPLQPLRIGEGSDRRDHEEGQNDRREVPGQRRAVVTGPHGRPRLPRHPRQGSARFELIQGAGSRRGPPRPRPRRGLRRPRWPRPA